VLYSRLVNHMRRNTMKLLLPFRSLHGYYVSRLIRCMARSRLASWVPLRSHILVTESSLETESATGGLLPSKPC
jgi:hypothetical protein